MYVCPMLRHKLDLDCWHQQYLDYILNIRIVKPTNNCILILYIYINIHVCMYVYVCIYRLDLDGWHEQHLDC